MLNLPMRRALRGTAAALATAALLAACGAGTDDGPVDAGADAGDGTSEADGTGDADGAEGAEDADAADAPDSVTVEHAMGSTEVPCTPQRVVTLGQGQTDTVLALGVTPVGVVEPWTEDWYAYLPDEVREAEVVGTELEPDLERIAALQPDLILGSQLRHEAFHDQLSQIAPTVFSETIGVAWKDNVQVWAEALCMEERGAEVLAAYEARADEVAASLGGLVDSEVSIVRFMADEVRIYLTGFPGQVLRDVGLERPAPQQVDDWEASEQLVTVSEERIPDMDGDAILVMVSGDWAGTTIEGGVDDTMDRWTSTGLWQGLDAVQRDAVRVINEEHWNLGGGILAANAALDDVEALLTDALG